MATEAALNSAKKKWIDATAEAISAEKAAREDYDDQIKSKFTTDSFDVWVRQNGPQFVGIYQEYSAKESAFFSALRNYDSEKHNDWWNKRGKLQLFWYNGDLGDGKAKGSNYTIIPCSDIENYDEITQAMWEEKQKAQA
ncbi:hypothetical protein N7478_011160 [Penicillium angulare]|uniref:uncharacterized protein n=1 Tax=Penicillium angulare TaxID=116970 RepID=UPI0025422615|nr:uncharacterized protein N7478_011160 [Penicillium angulare]KAJ5263555.1 hypothetical protein N7478_011160 [Penicillium angulare]